MTLLKRKIAVFGLGEAGGLIAADLAENEIEVHGFDPKPVPTPAGIFRHDNPADAVKDTDVVIALTASADAEQALTQAFLQIPAGALYADFATASAGLKHRLAEQCKKREIAFADIALMSVVPGKGLKTPALASGDGARQFVRVFSELGMPVEAIGDKAGDAATRKLLRSVMMKGLAAVVIEAMEAAHQAGCDEWLWENMAAEITRADKLLLARLIKGTKTHARRRLHEMEASSELLESLGVDPVMTQSTVANLKKVLASWQDSTGQDDNVPAWWPIIRT